MSSRDRLLRYWNVITDKMYESHRAGDDDLNLQCRRERVQLAEMHRLAVNDRFKDLAAEIRDLQASGRL